MTEPNETYAKTPIYWFVVFDQALKHGNYRLADRAQRELQRLGVDVVYRLGRRKENP